MSDVLVKVDGVSKKFCKSLKRSLWYGMRDMSTEMFGGGKHDDLRKNEFWAVKDVSFELKRGECLGLIGHNGAGKSTLLKMLNGLIKPDQGRIEMHGRIGALIELGAGFNPILTGRENIYNKGAILGFTKKEMDRKFDAIVDFAEIEKFIDMPVQNYSSGMKVRLGFAVSAQMDPDVLIIDEVLAVGDLGFKIKCLNALADITSHAAVIFVSHSMPQVSRISSEIMLMQNGKAEYRGPDVATGVDKYFSKFNAGERKASGTGRVQLLEIQSFPPSNLITYGLPFRFVVDLLVDPGISKLRVSAVIWNQELRPVADIVSGEGKTVEVNVPSSQKVCIDFTLPQVHLNCGKHSLAVIVSDPVTDEIYMRIDNALVFQVESHKTSWADVIWPAKISLS